MQSIDFKTSLIELVDGVKKHRALQNSFFQQWMLGQMSIEQIGVFARNYWEVTFRFPEVLAILILNVEDVSARTEYTKTLYSEMGCGNSKLVHSVLFEKFCNDLAKHMGNAGYLTVGNLKRNFILLEETTKLIDGEKRLYSQCSSVAAGAQLALEWQAYTMIRQLYDGARNYMSLWPNGDSFHESCEFFYIHIGSAEKEHKIEALTAACEIVEDEESFDKIQYGFSEHLNLLADFWHGIFLKINSQYE